MASNEIPSSDGSIMKVSFTSSEPKRLGDLEWRENFLGKDPLLTEDSLCRAATTGVTKESKKVEFKTESCVVTDSEGITRIVERTHPPIGVSV